MFRTRGFIFRKTVVYRVSQEECARLREGLPYIKVYRYNPKHLCPKFNGYGDSGQRKVCSSGGSTHCTCQLTSLIDVCPWVWCPMTESQLTVAVKLYIQLYTVGLYQNAQSAMLRQFLHSCVMYSAWNPKENHDMRASFFVVQFNGFMSLTN